MATPMGTRRSSSKSHLPVAERMLQVLPRTGLATPAQLEHLAKQFPTGGQIAMQALLNLMSSGVEDCVSWARECWMPEVISSVTGADSDKLELMEPIPLPPTAGSTLSATETCLEAMMKQLEDSVKKITNETASGDESLLALAQRVPLQTCLLVQRLRWTKEMEKGMREGRQMGFMTKSQEEIKEKIGARLRVRDIPEGEFAKLKALQILLHEQKKMMEELGTCKAAEDLRLMWKETARFYHDGKDGTLEFHMADLVIPIGYQYSPGPILVTTEFTRTLRWAYCSAMHVGKDESVGQSRTLVICGPTGSGKTGMITDVGRLLGMLPTVYRANDTTPSDEAFWRRKFDAAMNSSGGMMAPFIVAKANEASEAAMECCVKCADDCGVALVLTMTPTPQSDKLQRDLLAGRSIINMQEPDMVSIAEGLLSGEGLQSAEALAEPLANFLQEAESKLSKQQHYDFGARTLEQICTQVGAEMRKRSQDEKKAVAEIVIRCVLPKMVKDDVEVLKGLITEHFKIDPPNMCPPSTHKDGRWNTVVNNIREITKVEPDCIVLPVPESDEAAFFESFSKYLNREGAALVKVPAKLSDLTPAQLLGSMPKKDEKVQDGLLITELRKAMEEHEEDQPVWVAIFTGKCSPQTWESLHELLNDSGCLNLATGEQVRLSSNIRFLFVMPDVGDTPKDTFSRSAVVWTDP